MQNYFNEYKFRCSSLGKLMTGVNIGLTANQEKLLNDFYDKMKVKPLTDNQTITFAELLQKKKGNDKISVTTENYLKEIHRNEIFNRSKRLQNKYLTKGLRVEEKSFTLHSQVIQKPLVKNTKTFENEFIKGTPDNLQGVVRDFKSSWNIDTFPFYDTEIPSKDYYWQLQGYMALTGIHQAELIYCLVDTPFELIDDELRFLDRKCNLFDNNGNVRNKENVNMIVELISNLIFSKKHLIDYCNQSANVKIDWFSDFVEINQDFRSKVFKVDYDENAINALYEQIKKCRKVLNSYDSFNIYEIKINMEKRKRKTKETVFYEVKDLISRKQPFAMVKYYEWFILDKNLSNRIYMLVFIYKNKLRTRLLSNDEVYFIKNHKEIKRVIKNQDGEVYEFNNFKDFHKKTMGLVKKSNS